MQPSAVIVEGVRRRVDANRKPINAKRYTEHDPPMFCDAYRKRPRA
jgi:hypothetical protein